MKTIRITYCGLNGEGGTVTQAKLNATNQLTALVRDLRNHKPLAVTCLGFTRVVYRGAESWCSMALDGANTVGYGSRDDAIHAAVFDVADLAWSHDVSDDAAFACEALARYIPAVELANAVGDLASRWAWQRRYKAARDAGHNDNAAHHIAGGLGHLVT